MSTDAFVYQTMLTCIGNKRKLVENIWDVVDEVRGELGKERLNIVDGFAGSSVVARRLVYIADNLYVNDLELYSYLMARCYLERPTDEQRERVAGHIEEMNRLAESGPFVEGIICRHYAPKETTNIKEGERCFYTRENALIIDTLRDYIARRVEADIAHYCLAPLLNKASIHTNTAGVFKGFYKNGSRGCFGGKGENALTRIMGAIRVDMPIWAEGTTYRVHPTNKDINELVDELPSGGIDLMYLDPPYNQHPYGSNYFMLNVIARNEVGAEMSVVSGIPVGWNKSAYNGRATAVRAMDELIRRGLTKARYLLISYNNEGIIRGADWTTLLAPYRVKKYEITYDTYKGSRNLKGRAAGNKVIEIMYLVAARA
jgi:adenine-specific DNA-methyltransferase